MFTTLSYDNDIKIECNSNNLFQIYFSAKLNKESNINIRTIIQEGQIYKLLSILNKDLIEEYNMQSQDNVDYVNYLFNFRSCMSDFFDKSNFVKCRLNLVNKTIVVSPNNYVITGTTNKSDEDDHDNDILVKQCNINNLIWKIDIDPQDNTMVNYLSYQYNDPETNKLQKRLFAKIMSRILHLFKQFLEY
jgi:hypothetical protein